MRPNSPPRTTSVSSKRPRRVDDWRHPAGGCRYLPVAVLGVLQVVAVGEIMLMGMMAALAVMIFDAPGSTEKIENWVFFIGMTLLPMAATVLSAVAWGLYRRGRPGWAVATLAGVVLAGLLALRAILGPGPL